MNHYVILVQVFSLLKHGEMQLSAMPTTYVDERRMQRAECALRVSDFTAGGCLLPLFTASFPYIDGVFRLSDVWFYSVRSHFLPPEWLIVRLCATHNWCFYFHGCVLCAVTPFAAISSQARGGPELCKPGPQQKLSIIFGEGKWSSDKAK